MPRISEELIVFDFCVAGFPLAIPFCIVGKVLVNEPHE
jgi:hypothetical protein